MHKNRIDFVYLPLTKTLVKLTSFNSYIGFTGIYWLHIVLSATLIASTKLGSYSIFKVLDLDFIGLLR